jgi:hypothetical protein
MRLSGENPPSLGALTLRQRAEMLQSEAEIYI